MPDTAARTADNPILTAQAENPCAAGFDGAPNGRRRPGPVDRRRRTGTIRPPRNASRHGRRGDRPLDQVPQVRRGRPALARSGPLRALRRPRLHSSLRPAPSHRPRRHGHPGAQAVPSIALAGRRPPGIRRASGHRGDDRPARTRNRNRGRHGAGRENAGGPVRQIPRRSSYVGHGLGRRPDGGSEPRGDRTCGPSTAGKVDRPLRRQRRLDRWRHRTRLLGRCSPSLRRAWLGDQAGRWT